MNKGKTYFRCYSTSFFAVAILLALVSPQWVEARKVYRIGALVAEDHFVPVFDGFKARMAELGYVEGKNIKYDFQNAKGDSDALEKMARKIVQDKPDLIVTSSTTATVPVAKTSAGTNIPVVFLNAGDPLKFVKGYASSGNNLTGISSSFLELTEKRLELLKELVPTAKRVIALNNPHGENYEAFLRLVREYAKRLGLKVREIEIRAKNAQEVNRRLSAITRKLGDGLLTPPDIPFTQATEDITRQAEKERLAVIGTNIQTVRRGLLAAYSSDAYTQGQQGAVLVEKILKGARPSDLPIEQPFRLKLVINLKTAKAIGLKVPKEILLRADEVVE